MGQAETPAGLVIRGNVRYGVRLVRQRMQMLVKLLETHCFINRSRVRDYVQIVGTPVNHFSAVFIHYIGIGDVPFIRYLPVKCLGSRWYFKHFQARQMLLDHRESLTDSISRYAAGNRENLRSKIINLLWECLACVVRFDHLLSSFSLLELAITVSRQFQMSGDYHIGCIAQGF
ncbi:MAG: hypothetical protein ACD_39C01194G0002 [uncultured bacterium]|nr:MAG: hypothetical protein ACD_39C01194G0002 [uncultured bacterium]